MLKNNAEVLEGEAVTLIISCITRNHIVQVSDRRLTWLTGPNARKIADDNRNKATVVCNRLVVAYTGLAQIAGRKTDEWLLKVITEVTSYNPQRICEIIADCATKEFRKVMLKKSQKCHTFLVSGWAKFSSQNFDMTSFVSVISNALNEEGWLSEAKDIFQVHTACLAKQPFLVAAVGQPIDPVAQTQLIRQIRNYIHRERGPEAYIEMLATAIRNTAISNPLVGRNLMAVSLPRTALTQDKGILIPLATPMQSHNLIALYLPESGNEIVRYAPNYTCCGMSYKGMYVHAEP